MFLVVEKGNLIQLEEDGHYRRIYLTGNTLSESSLRKWANDVFQCPLDSSLEEVAKSIAAGGWEMAEVKFFPDMSGLKIVDCTSQRERE